jgi:hypothetical protein
MFEIVPPEPVVVSDKLAENIPVMQFNKGAESVLFSCMLSNALLYLDRKKTDAIAA